MEDINEYKALRICWRLGQPIIHSAAIEIDALYFTGNAAYLEALNLFHTG